MRAQLLIDKGKYKWKLRPDALHEGQPAELNWQHLLPPGVGKKYERSRLIASSKAFMLIKIEQPIRKWRSDLAASTVMNWYTLLRVLVQWMVNEGTWSFSALTDDKITAFLTSRESRHSIGPPSRRYIQSYIDLFEDLWTFRKSYLGAIRINVQEFEDEIWAECQARDARPWRAIDEDSALALVFDSLEWIRDYGPFVVETVQRIYTEQGKWVGLSTHQKKKRSTDLFASISASPLYEEMSRKCGAAKSGAGIARVFTCTVGAAMNVLLFTVGQRVSELLRLDKGCVQHKTSPDGVVISYIYGIAAKKGGLDRLWVAGEPVPEVVAWLEEVYKLARSATGLEALFISRTSGSSIPLPGRKLRRMTTASPVTAMRAFANSPFRKARPPIKNLHPHAARKTFAAFVVCRDKTALQALSLHFGHAFRAFTDGAYAGNLELQKLLSEANRQELDRALCELLSSTSLAGRAAKPVKQYMNESSGTRFRGKLLLRRTVDKLIAEGVRLAPCNWGYCLYSQPLSACGGTHNSPNELTRSPEVCSGCANFVVSDAHAAWWNERTKNDEEFLKQEGLPAQTQGVVEQRLEKSKAILRDLVLARKSRSAQ